MTQNTFAQGNCHTRISLLTCAPGNELYSTFGHTAMRIQDSLSGMDIVYNYGTFDFDDPDFYMKFVRGKLDYSLSVDNYPDFMYEYQYYQRSVQEQELNLSCAEKQQIITALTINMQGTNRLYKYDFVYDNCTTRVRDLIFRSLPGSAVARHLVPEGTTARNLIHSYLDKGGEPWSKLGIDILLGARLDKPVDNNVAMFLPDYLLKGVDSAAINKTQPVVKQKRFLLNVTTPIDYTGEYVPLLVFIIICGLIASLYFLPDERAKTISRFVDSFLLYAYGFVRIAAPLYVVGNRSPDDKRQLQSPVGIAHQHRFCSFFVAQPIMVKKLFLHCIRRNRFANHHLVLAAAGIKHFAGAVCVPDVVSLRQLGYEKEAYMMCQFTYNNTIISYVKEGSGFPVVLIHGFAEDSDVWKHQLLFLKQYAAVIIPDLPGSGQSGMITSAKGDITMADYADCMYALLQHGNITSCLVLGHSMGGYITLALAEKHPEILSGFGFVHSTAFADSREKKAMRAKAINTIEQYGNHAFIKSTTPNLFSNQYKATHADEIESLVNKGKNVAPTALQQYYKAMLLREDKTPVLQSSRVPILFIMGKEDKAAPLTDVLQQVHLPLVSYIYILENAGHMGMWEAPEKVNDAILAFITDATLP